MNGTVVQSTVKSGVGFGSALAMVISYTAHKSVLWAIIHGIFSWFYVVYFLFTR
jgi:ABC-type Fe3+-siderophore transport system permease subunit